MSHKYRAVLFDLDGTLVEFKFKVKESRQALINFLASLHFDMSNINLETKTQRIFDIILEQSKNDPNLARFEYIRAELSKILEEYEFKGFSEAKPHPGALSLLKYLKEEQVLCALVTNSGRKPVDSFLGNFGFLPYLDLVLTRDDVELMKPEAQGIVKALRILHVKKNQAIFVGDSVIDIQAAKKAGISCIGLTQGMSTIKILSDEGPDYLISSIERVKDIVLTEHI
ncbi:MAG: HAD family hydrolase [Nitrososphaerales archaeon]